MRILVCGGRDFDDKELFEDTLSAICYHIATAYDPEDLYDINSRITIISGGATGADTLAIEFAQKYKTALEVYPAKWWKYGKPAGMIRNQQMLDEGKPDLVVAFPGGAGTAGMIKLAKKAGVFVREVY